MDFFGQVEYLKGQKVSFEVKKVKFATSNSMKNPKIHSNSRLLRSGGLIRKRSISNSWSLKVQFSAIFLGLHTYLELPPLWSTISIMFHCQVQKWT